MGTGTPPMDNRGFTRPKIDLFYLSLLLLTGMNLVSVGFGCCLGLVCMFQLEYRVVFVSFHAGTWQCKEIDLFKACE